MNVLKKSNAFTGKDQNRGRPVEVRKFQDMEFFEKYDESENIKLASEEDRILFKKKK